MSEETHPRITMNSMAEEILMNIAASLHRRDDLSAVLNLRLVSKKWHRIATPFVYVNVQNFRPASDYRWNNYTYSTDLLCYICWKLAQRPDLSRFIKELIATPWQDKRCKLHNDTKEKLLESFHKVLSVTSPALTSAFKADIVSGLLHEKADAALALIFFMCRDLEVLIVPGVEGGYGRLMREMLSLALRQHERHLQLQLQHSHDHDQQQGDGEKSKLILGGVTHIRLGDYVNGMCVADALDLLRLPKLRDLRLVNLGDSINSAGLQLPPPQPQPRDHCPVDLTFEVCHLSGKGLGRLLAGCSAPRSLFIQMRTRNVQPWGAPSFAQALKAHGAGLEFLFLDTVIFARGPDDDDGGADTTHLLRALTSFGGRLRSLVLSRHDLPSTAEIAAALVKLPSLKEFMLLGTNAAEDTTPLRALIRGPMTPRLERVVCLPANHDHSGLVWTRTYESCRDRRRIPDPSLLKWYELSGLDDYEEEEQ
ncbi:hypothetical protein AAE478_001759 [Parahypoxylon ruwenzoriense]